LNIQDNDELSKSSIEVGFADQDQSQEKFEIDVKKEDLGDNQSMNEKFKERIDGVKKDQGLTLIFDEEVRKKEKEEKDMLAFINKDDYENKFLRSSLSDPTSALILV
jgi:hypothetical protein